MKQKGRPRKYPFETMNIGDTFFVPEDNLPASLHSIQTSAVRREQYGSLPKGFRVRVRGVENGVEVERIK